MGIYKITSPSGKSYIGQSRNIWKRMYVYRSVSCEKQPGIYNSLKKYGSETHKFELLEECKVEHLEEKEKTYKNEFINQYGWSKALFCELNDLSTGPKSLETRRKIGDSKRGKKWNEEQKMNLSKGKIGVKHLKPHTNKGVPRPHFMTEEIKEKISKANQKPKPPRTNQHCKNLGKSNLGKSKGHKGRISPMEGKSHKESSKLLAKLNNLGKNNKKVFQFSLDGTFIREWESQTIAAKALGRKSGALIGQCASNKFPSAYGYKWKRTKH